MTTEQRDADQRHNGADHRAAAHRPSQRRHTSWRSSWPIDRTAWKRLAVGFGAVVVGWSVVGLVLVRLLAPNVLTDNDDRVARWFVDQRTVDRNTAAAWGAGLANTEVKIAASLVMVLVMLRIWRRWHEAVFVALTLVFEATAFIVITFVVKRPRPSVVRLLDSPVDSSFPSGHVAAATVYGAIVIIVFWHTRVVWLRAAAIVVGAVVPIVVGLARMYQGMHFLSDVVAGVALGVVTLIICARIIGPPPDAAPQRVRNGVAEDDRTSLGT